MTITIAEPDLNNTLKQFEPEIAHNTRALLADIFVDGPAVAATPALTKEEVKAIKERVYAACNATAYGHDWTPGPESTVRALCIAQSQTARYTYQWNRNESYVMESAVQWLKGFMHQKGLDSLDKHPAQVYGASQAPSNTCHNMDGFVQRVFRPGFDTGWLRSLSYNALYTFLDNQGAERGFESTEYKCNSGRTSLYTSNIRGVLGTVYTEEDVAWFAGFLTHEDFLKLKFRRVRVGAAVKEVTRDDTLAQRAADRLRTLNNFDFILHPNDRPFGAEYIRMHKEGEGLESCMTHSRGGYDAPYNVHPCDVYSTAHYGQGDNGLVLVEALNGDVPVGRGILNVRNLQIVRWYGEHKALVMLQNQYNIQADSEALDGVRIALIQEDNKIASPYLDGCQYVDLVDDTLIIGSGDIEMGDTSGYQYLSRTQECCILSEEYPEDDMEYQDYSETWYYPGNTSHSNARQCFVTGEWGSMWDFTTQIVDGSPEDVHDCVSMNEHGYTYMDHSIGYTENPDQYYYDEDTERYYNEDDYNELIAEREAGQEDDNEEAA